MRALKAAALLIASTFAVASATVPSSGPDGTAAAATDRGPSPMTIVVEPKATARTLSPVLQGASIDVFYQNALGLWDPLTDAPTEDATAKTARAGVGLLRFPGGSPANLYDWKRSIGPSDERSCQTDGRPDSPVRRLERGYGPDEYMEIVRAVDARPEIIVPFPNASPQDVANWFEYMNAPVGTNPNGGTAWAAVRQENGSTEPYGVTRWEVGNEPYLPWQAFWMDSTDSVRRLAQFIAGDEITFVDEPLARNCDFAPAPLRTNRNPGQTFWFKYRLIKKGTTPSVEVGGVSWTEVDDLSVAGPNALVYVLDRDSGSITFGDGIHGAIPPGNRAVTASYIFEHEGFVRVYDALKATAAQIGLDISVCAGWAPMPPRSGAQPLGRPSFAQEMKRRDLAARYDCVAAHPYTSLGTDYWKWETVEDMHHAHMVGDAWAAEMVSALDADLAANSANDAFVAVTEMGALWFGGGPEREESVSLLPAFSATMTHAVYMISQWLRYAPMDVGWIIANDLAPPGLRGVLGGEATGFVYGAEAMTREILNPFFAEGSRWMDSRVVNQEQLTAPTGESWPTLMVGAVRGQDGAIRLSVVNRHMSRAIPTRIVTPAFPHDSVIAAATVRGASFTSYNDDGSRGGDNTVELTRSTIETPGEGAFAYVFPPTSVTVLTLRRR